MSQAGSRSPAAAPTASPSAVVRPPLPARHRPRLVYSTYLGGDRDDGLGIAVDGAGSAYVTGTHGLGGLPDDPGRLRHDLNGGPDAFVTKLDASGAALVYSTFLGGSSYDEAYDIAVDGAGSAYVTGHTDSADFPTTPGAFDTTSTATGDAFVTKLDASGTALVYSTYLGGSGDDARLRHRGRRRRQRLRDGGRLDGLPDDPGRLRHELQRHRATPS